MTVAEWPCVDDIPDLDPPEPYRRVGKGEHFPLVELPSGHKVAHLTSYADVNAVLSHQSFGTAAANEYGAPQFFPTPLPSGLLLVTDQPDHHRIRKAVSREFLADAVAGYRTYVAAESERLWSAAEAVDGPIDLVEHLALPLTWAVATKLLGLPGDAQTVAQTAAATVMKADWNTSEEIVSAYLQLWAYLGDFVSGKRATAPDGLVRTLRDRRADGYPLNDDEITGLVFSILLAGTQTASNVLVKALWVLLSAQSAAKSLRANPSLLSGWIEENSRLIPGGEILTTVRVAYRDVELPNGLIKVGDTVFPDAFLANRDPEVFSDPLRFDPTRGRTRHFGFGHGLHHCLGQALARVELEAVLSGLLSRNPALRADTASLKWENGLIFYRPKQLPIVFEH